MHALSMMYSNSWEYILFFWHRVIAHVDGVLPCDVPAHENEAMHFQNRWRGNNLEKKTLGLLIARCQD